MEWTVMQTQDDPRLDAALNELKAADPEPPQDLRPAVMEAVSRQRADGPRVVNRHGGTMTKKAMFGLAAAAAVILAIFLVTGFPPTIDNIQATIGQAKRYTAPQMGAADANVGDPAVQRFIQSETFAALLADREALKLLSNPVVARALANQDLFAELSRPNLAESLAEMEANGSLRFMLDDANLRMFMSGELRTYLDDAELMRYMNDADLRLRLTQADVRAALRSNGDLVRWLNADFASYLRVRADLRYALANEALVHALGRPEIVAALRSQVFAEALNSPSLLRAIAAPGVAAALRSQVLASAVRAADYARAVNSADFAREISAAELRLR
jgi:hypothetical protein